MIPINPMLPKMSAQELPPGSYGEIAEFLIKDVLGRGGELTGYAGTDDMGMDQSISFAPGAPERAREMLGTQGLPGSVSQMPSEARDIDPDTWMSTILPPHLYLAWRKGQDQLEESRMRNQIYDRYRTEQLNLAKRRADIQERALGLREEKMDKTKLTSLENLSGYLKNYYPDKVKELYQKGIPLSTDNVMFKARDIIMATGDEDLLKFYNESVKHNPAFDPIDPSIFQKKKEAKKKEKERITRQGYTDVELKEYLKPQSIGEKIVKGAQSLPRLSEMFRNWEFIVPHFLAPYPWDPIMGYFGKEVTPGALSDIFENVPVGEKKESKIAKKQPGVSELLKRIAE